MNNIDYSAYSSDEEWTEEEIADWKEKMSQPITPITVEIENKD